MGPFEYGFFSESLDLSGRRCRTSPPVDPEIACTTQAVREVLMDSGFSSDMTATFLRRIAGRIHGLEPQLNEQLCTRCVEQQNCLGQRNQ